MFTVSPTVLSQVYPSVEPQFDSVSIEQRLQQVGLDQTKPQPSQLLLLPQTEDDWFLWFDATREETATVPSGIQLKYVLVSSELVQKLLYFPPFAFYSVPFLQLLTFF